jgi:diphthamide biosynthesis protein 3
VSSPSGQHKRVGAFLWDTETDTDTDTDTDTLPFIQYHDNLAIISLYLETPPPAIEPEPLALAPAPATDENENENKNTENTALSLLAPDLETFYTTIPTLSLQLSTQLSNSISELRSLSSDDEPSTTTSNDPSSSRSTSATHHARTRARDKRLRTSMAPVKPLSTQLADQVAYLRQRQLFELPTARRAMAATAAQLLAVQTVLLERVVVVLERGMHGALARRIKARADHLGIVARGVEGKVEYVSHPPLRVISPFFHLYV